MKKAVLFYVVLQSCVFSVCAQELIYSVAAEAEGQRISLDSIVLENITNGTRICFGNLPVQTIYNIDLTHKVITSVLSIHEGRDGFYVYSNTSGMLTVGNHLEYPGEVKVAVHLLNGQKVFESSGLMVRSGELISVKIGIKGVCLVSLVTPSAIQAYKAVGNEGSGQFEVKVVSGAAAVSGLKKGNLSLSDGFSFSQGDSLRVSVYKESYYARPASFRIAGSRCLNFGLSLSSVTQAGVSDGFVELDKQSTEVKSYDESSGVVLMSFTGEKPQLLPGDVIAVDVDTMGYLRKIVGVTDEGDVTRLVTEQAGMNDVFVNKEFKLHTGLVNPGVQLKSTASTADISSALTDEKGYIHPVEVIFHGKDGKAVTKSALSLKSASGYAFPIMDIYCDLATDLYGGEGDIVRLYISEGHVSLTADAIFDFVFGEGVELAEDTKVKKGDLDMFRFYLDAETGFLAKLNLDMTTSMEKSDEKMLEDLEEVTAKFLVGVVPVWITFDVDILGNYHFSADASLNADWGFESKHKVEVGGVYTRETDSFTPINTYSPVNAVFPLNLEGEANAYARTEIFPRTEMKFYGFFGPYAEIVPFIKGNYNAKLQSQITSSGSQTFVAWNSGIDLGLDMRVGTELSFLGLFTKEIGPIVHPCFETPVWHSPVDINLVSVLPEETEPNSEIALEFRVTDLAGNPVRLCPVYVEGDGSFSQQILFTNTDGITTVIWTVGGNLGRSQVSATIYNSDKSVIKEVMYSVDVIEDTPGNTGTFTDSRDGRVYRSVKIGEQIWMAGNLAYLPVLDVDSTDADAYKYYYVYGYYGADVDSAKATDNYKTYGVLYNWSAALAACPKGWHLPSDAEWTTLTDYWNDNGYDSSLFSGIQGGRCHGGSGRYKDFSNLGKTDYWWTSTEHYSSVSFIRTKASYSDFIMRSYEEKQYGLSVRCLKN